MYLDWSLSVVRSLARFSTLFLTTFFLAGVDPAFSVKNYPLSELRAVETKREEDIRRLREAEIKQLKLALNRRAPKKRRADLYFRLAEIYLEAYRAAFLLEGRVHENRISQGKASQVVNRAYSRVFLLEGVKACRAIINFKIKYSRMDAVLYFLAFNYGELGKRSQSLSYYKKLINDYPGSPYAVEGYRELGDREFEKNRYKTAQAYYEMAIKSDQSGDRSRIYHRLAWSYYRNRRFKLAVATMKKAIDEASKDKEKFLSIRDEALHDLAVFMTEVGEVDEALRYFSKISGDEKFFPKALEKLGREYERSVRPKKATKVYETLLQTFPESEESFRVQVKLVDLDLRRGRFQSALKRLKNLDIRFGGELETVRAAKNLKAMVRRTATEHHEKYRKEKKKKPLLIADAYYSYYLDSILDRYDPRKETPEIQMYLAELKTELGQLREASDLYKKVIQSGDKRYAKEAGALWVGSLSDTINKQGKNAQGENAPSELEKEFVEASDELQEVLGGTREAREAELRSAQVLAGYSDSEKEAIDRARRIVEKSPRTSQALTAARLWIQVLSDRVPDPKKSAPSDFRERGSELEAALDRLRSNTALIDYDQRKTKGKLSQKIKTEALRIRLGNIIAFEREKDFKNAGKGYEAYAEDTANAQLSENAYGNAVAAYFKAKEYPAVSRLSLIWLKRFSKRKKTRQEIKGVATEFLIRGEFTRSAELFEQLGEQTKDPSSLDTAGRLYQGMGSWNQALAAWQKYLKRYSRSSNRWQVSLRLAKALDLLRRDGKAIQQFQYCEKGPFEYKAECGARLADVHLRLKNHKKAKAQYIKVSRMSSRKKWSPFIAYARFKLAETVEDEARFSKLSLPEALLKKALDQRLKFLGPLSKAYLRAVDGSGPWGVAALHRLARWGFKFAQDVDQIAPPEGATEEQKKRFQASLGQVSGPLKQKALETWKQAYQKAVEGEILSPTLVEISDHLADYQRDQFSRAQGARGNFRLAGMPARGQSEGYEATLQKVRKALLTDRKDSAAWSDYGNLLWGQQKPLLARIAYEYALALDKDYLAALNNQAVVLVSGPGEEDWLSAARAMNLLKKIEKKNSRFLPAQFNIALLLNYYRLFSKAKPYWKKVVQRSNADDAYDGYAIALQGTGQTKAAIEYFDKGTAAGGEGNRFSVLYHSAVRLSTKKSDGGEDCLDELGKIPDSIQGFEEKSVKHLKRVCQIWKSK